MQSSLQIIQNKTLLFVFLFLLSAKIYCQGNLHYTKPFGKIRLVSDLALFKQINEQANSGIYIYHNKTQVDSVFAAAKLSITEKTSLPDFYKIIKRINEYLGSSQNGVLLSEKVIAEVNETARFFPLSVKYINGQIIVTEYGSAVPFSSIILSINGKAFSTILSDLAKYAPTDGFNQTGKTTAITDNFAINLFWEYGSQKEFTIEYADGVTMNLGVKKMPGIDHATYFNHPFRNVRPEKYKFRAIYPAAQLFLRSFDIGSENSGTFEDYKRFLDTNFRFLKNNPQVQNLVVDLRDNNSVSVEGLTEAFKYFADKPFKVAKEQVVSFSKIPFKQRLLWLEAEDDSLKSAKITEGLQDVFNKQYELKEKTKYYKKQEFNPSIEPSEFVFKGKIYVLTNRATSAAGARFAAMLKGKKDVMFLGEETKGGYYIQNASVPLMYVLPATKTRIWFNAVAQQQWVNDLSTQPVGHGVMPDRQVIETFDDFLKQRDAHLFRTLRIILGEE